jgi:hypothetical protein
MERFTSILRQFLSEQDGSGELPLQNRATLLAQKRQKRYVQFLVLRYDAVTRSVPRI